MKNYPYGTVLKIQREYSINDIFRLMDNIKNIGMNYIVIWPALYWWENKSHEDYPYHTGHEILKYAKKIGIKIIMELTGRLTSLKYIPDFAMKNEYYPLNEDGTVNMHSNGYGYLNYNHPEVNSMIKDGIRQTVGQYKDYGSLYGYDVWNETMFSSYDEFTWRVFRKWLNEKYETIENIYNSKKHIISENISSMTVQEGTYERPQDDWNLADNVQHICVSMYPKN